MNEVSHLATDKDIVSIWSGIINVIYLLIAGVIGGFLTNWWKRKKYLLDKQRLEYEIELSRNKIEADKKSLRQQMITNNIAPMRQAWINDLRKTMADFLSQCETLSLVFHLHKENRFSENEIDANKDKIIRIKNLMLTYRYLVLLLPANEDEVTAIKNLMTGVMDCIINNTDTYDEDLVSISIKTQELLKREWEVTKSLKEIE